MSSAPKLTVAAASPAAEDPAGSGAVLMDAPLRISASGLPAGAAVTLTADLRCPEEKLDFGSRCLFRSGPAGAIDCGLNEALPGGTYEGISIYVSIFYSLSVLDST